MPKMFMLPSRSWLVAIADDYAARLGVRSPETSARATVDALNLLNIAPWHFRILVGTVEVLASFWCFLYRSYHNGQHNGVKEVAAFAKVPLISAPLLRVYRSLVALSWFEQPDVLKTYGIEKTLEQRQEHFRQLRRSS